MDNRSFPKQILFALVALAAIGAYPLWRFASPEVLKASLIGAGLATANVLAGYYAIEYAFGKSVTTFFKVVLGGMGLRLFGLAVLLVLFIKVLEVPAASLIISLGICYVVFLILEILFIQKKIELSQQS